MKHDGLHKRGRRWYCWMRVNGKLKACSTGTAKYHAARAIRARRLNAARAGVLFPTDLTFRQAAEEWLSQVGLTLKPVTLIGAKSRLRSAIKFFGARTLAEITPRLVLAYRTARLQKGIAPQSTNAEISNLRIVLRHFRAWTTEHAEACRPLRPVPVSGRASRRRLTIEEISRLRQVAARRWQWKQIRWAFELGLFTGMRSAEIRGLLLGDIDLDASPPRLTVRRASTKTVTGERDVLLFPPAVAALRELSKMARQRGSTHRSHYLFPLPTGRTWDPRRPMARWTGGWKTICKRAGLREVRFHDLRHTYITNAAESGAPVEITMKQVGHLNQRDTRGYTQVSDPAVYEALEKASRMLSTEGTQVA